MGKQGLAALAAAAVVVVVLVAAPVASAWHPSFDATIDCNGVVSYQVTADEADSSRDNPDIEIFDDAALTHRVASGAFSSADGWSFSGTFTEPSTGTTITLTVEAVGPWGDGHFESAPSSVTLARPTGCGTLIGSTTTTAVHDSSHRAVTTVPVGSTVHDAVTVTGEAGGPTPLGSVTIDWFANGTCLGVPAATSVPMPLTAGSVDATSFPQSPAGAGAFAFQAHYPGDGVYAASDGPCEPITVTPPPPPPPPAQPSLTTAAFGPVTVGGAIHDVAILTGAIAATGSVTFQVFGPGDTACSTPLATLGAVARSVDGNGNGTSTSASFTTTTVGTYRWRAFFSGDPGNAAVSTACNDPGESSATNQATPTLRTTASGPVTLGGAIGDVATLGGAVSATGAVVFTLYAPGDSSCAAPVATLASVGGTRDANGNGTYISATFTTTTVGTYRWRASFAGDAANAAAATACNDANEASTVNASPTPPTPPAPPGTTPPTPPAPSPGIAITKTPKEQAVPVGGTATWTIGVANTGNLTLTNVRVTDAEAPGCARTSSDIPALASLAPGASVSYACSRSGLTTSTTNVAIAAGTPPSGPDVTSTDTAHVTVTSQTTTAATPPGPTLRPPAATKPPARPAAPKPAPHKPKTAPLKPPVPHPSIAIVKDPKSQVIEPGGTATFRVTVTNTGDVPLHDVVVHDPRSRDCDRSLGTLAAGKTQSYFCTRSGVKAAFDNIATAVGTPPTGSSVRAHDHAPVTVAPLKPPVRPSPPAKPHVGHHKPKMTG